MTCPWEHDAPLHAGCVTWDIPNWFDDVRMRLAGSILAMWQPIWADVPPMMEPVQTVHCKCADCKGKPKEY